MARRAAAGGHGNGFRNPHVPWGAITALFVAIGVAGIAIYVAALHDDELSSHLPVTMQIGMGKDPSTWAWSSCFGEPRCWDRRIERTWWDRETYLRSQDRDVTGVCHEEYRRFAAQVDWLWGDGYWPEYWNICKRYPAGSTTARLLKFLPPSVSEACSIRIDNGWIVGDDGSFYHPYLYRSARPDFVAECLPPSPIGSNPFYFTPQYPPLVYLGY